jgi:hypothetical protein
VISYSQACQDPNLFGPWFAGESWTTWRVIEKALFGEPLDAEELAIFKELTGRDEAPSEQAIEAWIVAGRRSGKDVRAASIAVYLATIGAELLGFRKRLVRGERGVVQLLAVDRNQAQVCMGYTKAFFEQPMLAKLVKKVTGDSVELKNGLAIEITTNDQRRARGRTVVAAIFDEVAHWRSEETANPDEAIYQAVKPAMITMMPGAMLIGISSPYARKGLLWRKYQANYGKPGSVLVVKAPTWKMNLTLSRDSTLIADAYDADPAWASAEYGAEFRTDVETLFTLETVQACVEDGIRERPPVIGHRYFAFADPSGGSVDSMTLGIAHKEGSVAVLDCLREVRPPFSPESVVGEFVVLMQRYGVQLVCGDRYGGQWVQSAFLKAGVQYLAADRSKSEIFLDIVPQVNSRQVRLLDNERLVNQLVSLERRVGRGTGRDIIDHPPGGHDDIANAAAGAIISMGFVDRHQAAEPPKTAYDRDIEAWKRGELRKPLLPRSARAHMLKVEANLPPTAARIKL